MKTKIRQLKQTLLFFALESSKLNYESKFKDTQVYTYLYYCKNVLYPLGQMNE